jgi:apolipoprotein N-acyltransferase
MRPLMPGWRAIGVSALAGLVMWLAFPPVAFGPYVIAGVALTACWRASWRRGLGLGAITGMVFFGLLLGWMRVIGWDAWLLLTLLCASWFALTGMGTALVSRLPAAPVWIGSWWVLEEALRSRVPFGGFPWGQLAFAQADTTYAPIAATGGSALLTFTLAFVGSAIVTIVLDYRAGDRHPDPHIHQPADGR